MRMDDEENTARGGLGPPRAHAPVHRSTAPAGTPAKPSDPANPVPARTPSDRPRTVGGHTARLNIAEEAVPPSYEAALGVRRAPEPAEPAPRHGGGTMRIQVAPTLTGPPAPEAAPQPAAAAAPRPAAALQPAAAQPALGQPASAVAPPAALPEGDIPAWKSPLSAAVGLVFFATGSMLGVGIDARIAARARALGPAPTAAATASSSAPPAPPSASAAAPPSASAAPPPAAPASASPAPRPSSSAAAPPRAGTARPPVGKPGGKSGLIFHDP